MFQDVLPALLLSLKVSFWASGLNLVLGVAVGWLLARCRFPGRNLLDVVLTLPMVLPPTVMGYYLLVLFGRNGVLGQLLQEYFGISLIFTWQGSFCRLRGYLKLGRGGFYSELTKIRTRRRAADSTDSTARHHCTGFC